MALTRPTIYNLNTNVEVFNDSLTVLNAGATAPNTDVGFIFNRAQGLVPNAAVYWSESLQSVMYALTNSDGATNSNVVVSSYANVTVGNVIANTAVYSTAYFYANGVPFSSSNYGNAQMLANLAAASNPVTFGSNIVAASGTTSTSTTTGALVVSGGAGIAGNLYVGGNLFVTGNTTTQNYEIITYTEVANVITATGNITTTANIYANTAGTTTTVANLITTSGLFWANGVNALSPSYGNTQMLANLAATNNPVTFGSNIVATNVNSTGTVTASGNVAFIGNSSVGAATPTTILLQGQLQPYTAYSLVSDVFTNTVLTLPDANWQIIEAKGTALRSVLSRNSYGDLSIGQNYTGYIGSIQINAGSASTSQVKFVTGSAGQYLSNFDNAGNLNVAGNAIINGGQLTVGNLSVTSATVANLITASGVFWPNGAAYSSGSSGSGPINLGIYVTSATVTTAPTLVDSVPLSGNTGIRWTTTAVDNISANVRMSTIDVLANVSTVNYTEYGYLISNTLANTATFTSNIYSGSIALWAQGSSSSVTITVRREILGSGTTTGYINVGPTGPAGTISATTSNIVTTSTSTSVSTTTGALQVAGGVGIGGNVYIGGNIYANTLGTTTTVATLITTSGLFWANGAAYSSGSGAKSTSATTPPSSPAVGDIWYNTTTDDIYRWTTDGVSSYWLDITGATVANVPANLVGTTLTTTGNVTVGGSLYVTSNVVAGTTTRVEYNIPHPFMLMGT